MLNCLQIYKDNPGKELLEDYCSRISFVNLINSFKSLKDAIPIIKSQHIDLVFLDFDTFDLQTKDGLNEISEQTNVILLTTWLEFEIDSFDLPVNKTLFQPLSFSRFLEVFQKL